jgi:UDP-2-acetamido-3-amino-2,3-dideoxy-glucuronate N-acetyltransferase
MTDVFVHETAVIDTPCEIGAGTRIWHFCHVMSGARIGHGCNLGQSVFVGGAVVIGDGVKIQNNVSVYDGVVVEDDAFIGPSAVFTNVSTPRSRLSRRGRFEETVVGRGATVGANATVVCGNRIGAHAFIGAGAVVTRDVPDHALVTGVPGRLVGWVCRCGAVLPEGLACAECGARYREKDGSLKLAEVEGGGGR